MDIRRIASAAILVCATIALASCSQSTAHTSKVTPSPTPTAFPRQTTTSTCPQNEPTVDDRTMASQIVRSYFNAIDRHEYFRAYSYLFAPSSFATTPTPLPTGTPASTVAQFEQWQAGYLDTACVIITGLGFEAPDATASLVVVPITFVAISLEGDVTDYAGDYVVQDDPALGMAQSGFLNLPLSAISAV